MLYWLKRLFNEYGDAEGVARILVQTARREGLGGLIAEGITSAGEELGMADQTVHVKGLEPAGYEPRVLKGMGLAYAVSPRGACHLRSTFYKPESAGMIDPDQIENKAEMFLDFEDRCTLFDTMILCPNKRLLKEKLDNGKGITKEELNILIQDYYRLRGWSKDGIPKN